MKDKQKWFVYGGAIVFCLLVLVYIMMPKSVTVAVAKYKEMPVSYQGEANVVAEKKEIVKSPSTGTVLSYAVKVGDRVVKGQLLATLDTSSMQQQIQALEAKLASLQETRTVVTSGVSLSNPEAARAEELYSSGIITESEYRRLQSRQQIAFGGASETVVSGGSSEDRGALIAAISTLQEKVLQNTIVSPMDGEVVSIYNEANKAAFQDQPFMLIQESSPVVATLTIPNDIAATLLPFVNAGTDTVSLQVKSEEVEGKLLRVGLGEGGVGLSIVQALFDNSQKAIDPGSFYTLTVKAPVQKQTLVVPTSSVHKTQEGYFVYAVTENQTVDVRVVTVGGDAKGETSILSGLVEGDRVITSKGNFELGQKVSP